MKVSKLIRGLGALGVLAAASSCHSLDVTNPNAPSSKILTDPSILKAVAGGTMRTWFNAYNALEIAGVLDVQALTLASSWNNGNINSYQHIGIGPADTITSPATWTRPNGWYNDLASPQRSSVERWWYDMYSVISSANDALKAIRVGNVNLGDAGATKSAEAVAQLMQGASYMLIANDFDQGYYVDEHTPGDSLLTLIRVPRKTLRDSAVAMLQRAATIAAGTTFDIDPTWTKGIKYNNKQIAQIANTLAAYALAYYARDAQEATTAVDWAKVADFASKGISSGTPVSLEFMADGSAWYNDMDGWFTDISTGRISTRVAHFLDPATQLDPYPLGVGSAQPNSPDLRLGDGTFGQTDIVKGWKTIPKDAGGGTYFAYSTAGEIFRPDRGFYAQSNIGIIRNDESQDQNYDFQPGEKGKATIMIPSNNDLLWAEALLRRGQAADLPKVVALINNTRVAAGGLPAAAVTDPVGSPADADCMSNGRLAKDGGTCTLWSKLLYEQDIEYLQMGPISFWHQRELPVVLATAWERASGTCRTDSDPQTAGKQCTLNVNSIYNGPRYIQGLIPGTAREMPVPAKELAIHQEAFYSFGGSAQVKGTEAP
jgi:hypothetical protein